MIAKPDISTPLKYLAFAFLLLLSPAIFAQSSAQNVVSHTSTLNLTGLSSNRNDYYRNLIMQDIATPQQIPLDRMVFTLDVTLSYRMTQVAKGKYELTVEPKNMDIHTVGYFGFDISSSLKPHIASITFRVNDPYGLVHDSIVFKNLYQGTDSSLYFTRSFQSDITSPSIVPANLKVSFSEQAYDYFRQEIAVLDDYFAAAALLDSVLHWSDRHYPAGSASVWGNYLQQLETTRIIRYVEKSSFNRIPGLRKHDPAGYYSRLEKAKRKKIRVQTILERQVKEELDGINKKAPARWVDAYFQWLIAYHEMAAGAGYRYSNYFSGLVRIELSNGMLAHQGEMMDMVLTRAARGNHISGRKFLLGRMLAEKYAALGLSKTASGETVEALKYDRNALELRKYFPGLGTDSLLTDRIKSLQSNLAGSYLRLATLAAEKENLRLSEGYLEKAAAIAGEYYLTGELERISQQEKQLYDLYLGQAKSFIASGRYSAAVDYAGWLEEKCSMGKYDCTGELKTVSLQARRGRYLELLSLASARWKSDEPDECRAFLDQAIGLRYASAGLVERDPREALVTASLDRLVYEENTSEGQRYLHFGEYEIALYYLNKARAMELDGRVKADPGLEQYIRQAARPVIISMISTAKARAMGYYFEESWEMINRCRQMIHDYRMEGDSSLTKSLYDLDILLRVSQCRKFEEGYSHKIDEARRRMEQGEYERAMEEVSKAIGMALDDTVCNVNDQQAWYLKALLEYPAEFDRRQEAVLDLIPADPEGFVQAYQELQSYYHEMELEKMGVKWITLHERVMAQDNPGFLNGMLAIYARQRERDKTADVVRRMWDLHGMAPERSLQESIARWSAVADAKSGCPELMTCLNQIVPDEKAFQPFRRQYKSTWIKESGWKIRYFFLFLKK